VLTRDQLLQKTTELLSELLDDDNLKLSEATTADTVEGWDSINHVRLLIGLEKALGIQFETDEVSSIKNVGGLIDVIQRKL